MSDNESDSSDSDIPPREVCEERCQNFAAVTGTDSALAMFYLQDRDWDLQRAINAYFEDNGGQPQKGSKTGSTKTSEKTQSSGSAAADTETAADPEPHRIRLMSWNIDGLDQGNLNARAKAVCNTINKEKPDIVYLQEVIEQNQLIIEENCPLYHLIPGNTFQYYTAILCRVDTVTVHSHNIKPFKSSAMLRNLLTVQATVKGVKMTLMTSHLESTKEHQEERKKQLKTCLATMQEADPSTTVIFGGDLNLRDPEMVAIGGAPEGIYDLWEVTGKRPEAKFTWDMMRNDNLDFPSKFKPRCRFDRLFLRHPKEGAKTLKPVYFELVGIERLPGCRRFPSDHWGLLTHYDKL